MRGRSPRSKKPLRNSRPRSSTAFTSAERARAGAWDRQIEADAASGKLDHLREQAKREIAAGEAVPLDEVLDGPSFRKRFRTFRRVLM